jgi:hypothetical protein
MRGSEKPARPVEQERASERELEAIFGWSGGRTATLYTKSANRGKLAAGGIGTLDRAETENRMSVPAPMAEVRARKPKMRIKSVS